jgi:hypothetical protein
MCRLVSRDTEQHKVHVNRPQNALAAWRSGHRIRLRNKRPVFESRHNNVVFNRLNVHTHCVELRNKIKALATFKKLFVYNHPRYIFPVGNRSHGPQASNPQAGMLCMYICTMYVHTPRCQDPILSLRVTTPAL